MQGQIKVQVGLNHYVSNQHLGQAQTAQQAARSGAPETAGPADDAGRWQDDQVSWSDRLYELHDLAQQVRLEDINFREVGELRQALYERGWISPDQAVALTELGAGLSDRLQYRMEDVLNQGMQSNDGIRRALTPILTAVQNIASVQTLQNPSDENVRT